MLVALLSCCVRPGPCNAAIRELCGCCVSVLLFASDVAGAVCIPIWERLPVARVCCLQPVATESGVSPRSFLGAVRGYLVARVRLSRVCWADARR